MYFNVVCTVAYIVVALIVFFLLGSHLSKPFDKLINDVKSIDMTKNEFARLSENGLSEFSFLRKSINGLLNRIEIDQRELIDSKETLHATLLSVGDGVISVDNKGNIQFMNPTAQRLTGWKLEDAISKPIESVFVIINELTREPADNPVKLVFETEEILELSNHTILLSRDGTEIPIEDSASPIKDMLGTTVGCVLVFRDFSERREKQRHIEFLSYHDQLTGLYNRRYFEEEINRIYVEKNLPFSIIYADINGLKLINDAFGHGNGDKIIQWIAALFTDECEPGNIITRIGGDEFVILLPKTDEAKVEDLARRIFEKTEENKFMDIYTSISLGWDTGKDPNQYSSDVLKNAEDFMYQKKILNSTNKRNEMIRSIYNSLLQKCPGEKAHFTRVSNLCEKIGRAFNLSGTDIKELIAAGELHDIGKIVIDEAILNKTRDLSESEVSQMKHHPEIGFRLLGATNEYLNVAEHVHSHHERWDGAGYPRGLKGEDISWKARVVAVADAYDAMTFGRPYREAISTEDAIEDLKKNAGTQFDPDIVKVFIEKVLGLEW